MSSAKVVPTQLRSSPMTVIVRRLPDWQGEMVSAALDEQSLNALRALTARHQQTAVSVLCEAIERARDRAGISAAVKSYPGMLAALAIVADTKRSAVVRTALVMHYREVFGREPTGRAYVPRAQQFEGVRRVYQDAHRAVRRAGGSKAEARSAAEQKARAAFVPS